MEVWGSELVPFSPVSSTCTVLTTGGGKVSLLNFARVDYPILDNIYNKVPSFQVGHLTFTLTESERYEEFPDYSVFTITQGEETVRFLIGVVDTDSVTCGSKSNINLLEFLWEKTMIFSFLKYGIVCVPLA